MRRRDLPAALIGSAIGAGVARPASADDATAQTAAEREAGVQPVNPRYAPGQPERYVDPGFSYAAADGRSGTDFTAAINQALSVIGQPVTLGAHNYLITNLTIPATQTLLGQGMHQSNLICRPGSTGTMFTDRGGRSGAAKIDITGIAFYGNHCAYSHGFRLGCNSIQFGTEGKLDRIWVRDLPGGFPGIDINGNVGEVGFLVSQDTGGLQILGSALMASQLECVGGSGFAVGDYRTVCNFGDAHIGALEVEAQANDTAAVYLSGNTHLDMLTVSLAPAYRGDHLIEIGPRVTSWAVDNLKFYFQGAAPVLGGGNFKVGGSYFGGNITGRNRQGEGSYSSGLMTQSGQFGFKLQQFNAFTVRVENSAGTLHHLLGSPLQHRIGAVGAPDHPSAVATSVRDASATPSATPTGPDASTGFAAGAKVSSAEPDALILDTGGSGRWEIGDSAFTAVVSLNTSGTAYTVLARVLEQDVAGARIGRLHLSLRHAATGAATAWVSALARPGALIDVTVTGFLR